MTNPEWLPLNRFSSDYIENLLGTLLYVCRVIIESIIISDGDQLSWVNRSYAHCFIICLVDNDIIG